MEEEEAAAAPRKSRPRCRPHSAMTPNWRLAPVRSACHASPVTTTLVTGALGCAGAGRGARARGRGLGRRVRRAAPSGPPPPQGRPARPLPLSRSLSPQARGGRGGREGTGWTPGPRRSDPGRWRRRPGPHGPVRVVYRLRPITFSCSWLRKFPVTLAPLHELLHLRLVLVPAGNSRARRRGRDWARPAGPRRSPPLPAAPGSTLLLRRVVPAGGGSAGRGGSFSGRGRPAARRRRRRDWGWGAGGGPLPRSFLPRSSRSALTCARARAQGRRSRRGTASSSRGGRARGGRGRRPRCRRT